MDDMIAIGNEIEILTQVNSNMLISILDRPPECCKIVRIISR